MEPPLFMSANPSSLPKPSPADPAHELRMTTARKEIYEVLVASKDHPTATDVFLRVKPRVPGISLATVYNNLEALTQGGRIKQVNLERAPSRFCANQHEHVHFHCDTCGCVMDADVKQELQPGGHWQLPEGASINRLDVTIRGLCPTCAAQQP